MVGKTPLTPDDNHEHSGGGSLPARGVLRRRSQRAALAQSWWATAWEEALLKFIDAGRLSRGRGYARRGQVLELQIGPGQITARVQGTRPTPYRLRVATRQFSDADWARAIDSMAQQAGNSAMLLNGELPREIAGLFEELGLALFPDSSTDIEATCSCPDEESPCRHLAAVLLRVGEQLDREPFLLLELRGRTQEQVVTALRERRADLLGLAELAPGGEAFAEGEYRAEPAGGIDLQRFWKLGAELAALQVRVRPPDVEHEVLHLLGDPEFAGDEELMQRLEAVYEAVSSRALEVAFGDLAEILTDENGGNGASQ